MSAKRVYTDYLQDIVDYAEKAMRFVEDVSFDDFGDNEEKIFAVVKTLEIIGEAARHLPKSMRDKYTSVELQHKASEWRANDALGRR